MDADFYSTNEDCKRCICSYLADVGSEYPDHEWRCTDGWVNEGAQAHSKPCGLAEGAYYTKEIRRRSVEKPGDTTRKIRV